jgi:hypothetical protein
MSTIHSALRRAAMLSAVSALAVVLLAPAAANASPGSEASEWLASQLKPTSEGSYCEVFGEASVGETIECTLAFKAAGSAFEGDRQTAYRWVLANKSKYVGTSSCETTTKALSAGAVAQLALGVEAEGANPENVEGRNLIADLKCLQIGSGTEAGRFADKNQTDFSNVSDQSLAIIALKACEVSCAGKPNLKTSIEAGAAYLRSQQCAGSKPKSLNGAFRSTMGLPANTCKSSPPFFPEEEREEPNGVEVDSTATAIQALLADGTSESSTAAAAAQKWLKKQQKKGQFWENYCSESEPTSLFASVNSTALAVIADVEGGISSRKAQKWLDGAVAAQPVGERGLPACTQTGPPNVLATTQGILGLFGASYPQLVGLP